MIFNETYKFGKDLDQLSQEEILNTPAFYAMPWQEILRHPECPNHLKKILSEFDWDGRPNYVQVRIQDHRVNDPYVLGTAWHVDVNTILANGRHHLARDLFEFRSMTASFGGVRTAEFVGQPLAIDTDQVDPFNHPVFAGHVAALVEAKNPLIKCARDAQLVTYTSRDAHRASPLWEPGVRLIIVTVEQDKELEAGAGYVSKSLARQNG